MREEWEHVVHIQHATMKGEGGVEVRVWYHQCSFNEVLAVNEPTTTLCTIAVSRARMCIARFRLLRQRRWWALPKGMSENGGDIKLRSGGGRSEEK